MFWLSSKIEMKESTIYIKNMVCDRCIAAVKQTLTKLDIPFSKVVLGSADIEKEGVDLEHLAKELETIGFELIQDKNIQIVENVKALIVNYIHYNKSESLKINFSEYLSTQVGKEYSFISKKFSEIEKTTIEKFIILQKIEKVKELISYNELNFSEIAFQLNYSSVAHLSKQFKNITGKTLSDYKKTVKKERKALDKV